MSKHTPGPWKVGPHIDDSVHGCGFIVESGGPNICITDYDDATDMANAPLIAAAPELLEALEKWVAWAEQNHENDLVIYSAAVDAIAKAKGDA